MDESSYSKHIFYVLLRSYPLHTSASLHPDALTPKGYRGCSSSRPLAKRGASGVTLTPKGYRVCEAGVTTDAEGRMPKPILCTVGCRRKKKKSVISSRNSKSLIEHQVTNSTRKLALLSDYPYLRRRNYKIVEKHSWVKRQKIFFQPNNLQLQNSIPKVRSSCTISQQKKVENFFVRNFFLYFDTLKPEKKYFYWPLVISFLPTALQRRILRSVLLNQNWKDIRYSQVENFLKKRTILQ